MTPPTERPPDTIVVAGGNLVGVYVCKQCGAAIMQRSADEVDRPRQHADWHRWYRRRFSRILRRR